MEAKVLRDGEMAVKLEWYEIRSAADVGVMRQVMTYGRNSRPRFAYRSPAEAFGAHVMGAIAECAVAKALGWYWPASVDTFRLIGDVGEVEVRYSNGWTDRTGTHEPELKVRPDEKPDALVVLVSGDLPTLLVRGWIRAREAMHDRYSKAPRAGGPPAFFLPLDRLHPMDTLREGTWAADASR
jgi:hypothetical protein